MLTGLSSPLTGQDDVPDGLQLCIRLHTHLLVNQPRISFENKTATLFKQGWNSPQIERLLFLYIEVRVSGRLTAATAYRCSSLVCNSFINY